MTDPYGRILGFIIIIIIIIIVIKSCESLVCTATGYVLDSRSSNRGRGKICPYSTASRPVVGPTQPIKWALGAVLTGVKQPGREDDH
jgi:hypothetical protein